MALWISYRTFIRESWVPSSSLGRRLIGTCLSLGILETALQCFVVRAAWPWRLIPAMFDGLLVSVIFAALMSVAVRGKRSRQR